MAATLDKKPAPHAHAHTYARPPLPGPVAFVGAGKVGTALARLLHERGVQVAAVSGRTQRSARSMAAAANLDPRAAKARAEAVEAASIVFLTVPDDAITPLCEQIAQRGGWRPGQGVVHCSGALSSDALRAAREAGALAASFHPLQTFADLEAAVSHMPGSTFALEGDPPLVEQLQRFVALLDGTSLCISTAQKTLYHAAATITSNYTVTLAALAAGLLVRDGIAPDPNTALRYLLPLLRGTVDNLEKLGLPGALTGPLARGDSGTVALHIGALAAADPELARLYQELARLTLPLAREKGPLSDEQVEQLRESIEGTEGVEGIEGIKGTQGAG